MALPSAQLPAGFPNFKASDHNIVPDDPYGTVKRQVGSSRRRPLYTNVPRTVETALELTQSQLVAFTVWYRDVLLNGTLPFAAPVAKVGSGLQYWKAFITKLGANYQEGSHHVLPVVLRIYGPPENVILNGSMAGEISFFLDAEMLATSMAGEIQALLDVEAYIGDLLSGEIRVPLYAEGNGPLPYADLGGEIELPLEGALLNEGSADLAGEVIAVLELSIDDAISMAGEVSVPLLLELANVGYVASPAPISVSAFNRTPSVARMSVLTDGRVSTRANFNATHYPINYYNPTLTGIAVTDNLWVKVAITSVTDPGSVTGTFNSFIRLDANMEWSVFASVIGDGVLEVEGTVYIAKDPDGVLLVSQFDYHLDAEAS